MQTASADELESQHEPDRPRNVDYIRKFTSSPKSMHCVGIFGYIFGSYGSYGVDRRPGGPADRTGGGEASTMEHSRYNVIPTGIPRTGCAVK